MIAHTEGSSCGGCAGQQLEEQVVKHAGAMAPQAAPLLTDPVGAWMVALETFHTFSNALPLTISLWCLQASQLVRIRIGDHDVCKVERRHLVGKPGPLGELFGDIDHVVSEDDLVMPVPSYFLPEAVCAIADVLKGQAAFWHMLAPPSIIANRQSMMRWRSTIDFFGFTVPPLIGDALVERQRMRPSLGGQAYIEHLRVSAMVLGDRLACHLVHYGNTSSCAGEKLVFELVSGDYDPLCKKVHLENFTRAPGLEFLQQYIAGLQLEVDVKVVDASPDTIGLSTQTVGGGWGGRAQLLDITSGLRYGNAMADHDVPARQVIFLRRDRDDQLTVDIGDAGSWVFSMRKGHYEPNDAVFSSNDHQLRMTAWSSRVEMRPTAPHFAKGLPMWAIERVLLATEAEVGNAEYKANLQSAAGIPRTCHPVLHSGYHDTTPVERANLGLTRALAPYMAVVVSRLSIFPIMKFEKEYERFPREGPRPIKKVVEISIRQLPHEDDTIEAVNGMVAGLGGL